MNNLLSTNNFNYICRLCLLTNENMRCIKTEKIISEMVEECTPVQDTFVISNLPQHICDICYGKLKSFFDFKQKCQSSLEILVNVILEWKRRLDKSQLNEEKLEINSNANQRERNILKYNNTVPLRSKLRVEMSLDSLEITKKNVLTTLNSSETLPNLAANFNNINTLDIPENFEQKSQFLNENELESSDNECLKIDNRKKVTKKRSVKKITKNQNGYICDICGKKFKERKHANVHKIAHSTEKPYECKICHKSFKYTFTLTTHVRLKHSEPDCREICFVCGKTIIPKSFSYHLSTHRRLDNEKHKCDTCHRAYTREDILRRHIREKHTDCINKRFHCELCNKTYVSKGSLKIHKAFVHTNIKNISCHICGQQFKMLCNRNAHINSAHRDLRPHICSICNKAFHTKTLLTKHMRCHTGERPFTCTVCEKAFGTKWILKTHMKVHSKQDNFEVN